jgi:hypothetical protein
MLFLCKISQKKFYIVNFTNCSNAGGNYLFASSLIARADTAGESRAERDHIEALSKKTQPMDFHTIQQVMHHESTAYLGSNERVHSRHFCTFQAASEKSNSTIPLFGYKNPQSAQTQSSDH